MENSIKNWVIESLMTVASLCLFTVSQSCAAQSKIYSASEIAALQQSAASCHGGYIQFLNGDTHHVTVAEIVENLSVLADPVDIRPNPEQARKLYDLAQGLLMPALLESPRALDGGKIGFDCKPDGVAGARLMTYLVGDGLAGLAGPTNSIYWLGQAYRQGVGVPRDPEHGRVLLLQSRVRGNIRLTADDWGRKPSDKLNDILREPAARRYLESAAQLKVKGQVAQELLGDLLVAENPMRARSLIEESAGYGWRPAIEKLAQMKRDGIGGPRDTVGATIEYAKLAQGQYVPNVWLDQMVSTALAYNAPLGEIPIVTPAPTLLEMGGRALLPKPEENASFISMRDSTPARALLAPDGRIVFTMLVKEGAGSSNVDNATRWIWRPDRLPKMKPYVDAGGRAVFAWVPLPALAFEPPLKPTARRN